MKKFSGIRDANLNPIPYGALIDFCWWGDLCTEWHFKAKIRHRKSGDIFEFLTDEYGKPVHFTHRLSALNWTESDLELIES